MMMNTTQEKQAMTALNNRDNETFILAAGDQVRLENQIFTVTSDNSFLGRTENHTADIPFYGEIYKAGSQSDDGRTLLKENDRLAVGSNIYRVANTPQVDGSMHHVLVKTN